MSSPQSLAASLGLELVEVVADRRGSWLLKVKRGADLLALKGFDPAATDTYDRRGLIVYEAQALRTLGAAAGNQYIAHSEQPGADTWLLLRWVPGLSASEVASSIRQSGQADGFVPLFRRIARAYVGIHAAGFLHGDVQPRHTILEPGADQATVLDWGLSRSPGVASPPYKGGFVHYAAPEIARAMLAGQESMNYDLAAEMYSLGALMFFALTGQTAVDYGPRPMGSIPLEDKLQSVAEGRLREFPPASDGREQLLQRVIVACLRSDPASRTSSSPALLSQLQEV